MSSGMADYQRIIRPKYGAARDFFFLDTIGANIITTLYTLSGKGMIYGGYIWINSANTQQNSVPLLVVDGEILTVLKLKELESMGLDTIYSVPVYLKMYDNVAFEYTVCFTQGITFETGFEVRFHERGGSNPLLWSQLFYALI